MSDTSSTWTIGAVIGAVSFAASWIVHSIQGGWKARGVVADLDQKIAASGAAIKDEMRTEHDAMSRDHEKKMTEIHEKYREFEIWTRDHFVRQPHFTEVVTGINRSIEMLAAKMEAKMDRGFDKLGNQIEKLQARE